MLKAKNKTPAKQEIPAATAGAKRKLSRAEKKQIAAIIQKAKGDGKAHTTQQSIPYLTMYPDGICRVTDKKYSKCVEFEDINYQLAQADDKTAIFENWCDFLNCATRSHTNATPLTKNLWAQDHVALKMGGFQYCVEATTDILKSGMMG